MNIAGCIDKVLKERDYLGAANSIVANIIREKSLQIGKERKDQITIKVAKILKQQHTKLRTVDSGVESDEIVEKVCTLAVMKTMELLHLPNDM